MTNSSWLLKRKIFYRSDFVDESMECEVFCFRLRHLVRNLVEKIFLWAMSYSCLQFRAGYSDSGLRGSSTISLLIRVFPSSIVQSILTQDFAVYVFPGITVL